MVLGRHQGNKNLDLPNTSSKCGDFSHWPRQREETSRMTGSSDSCSQDAETSSGWRGHVRCLYVFSSLPASHSFTSHRVTKRLHTEAVGSSEPRQGRYPQYTQWEPSAAGGTGLGDDPQPHSHPACCGVTISQRRWSTLPKQKLLQNVMDVLQEQRRNVPLFTPTCSSSPVTA